MMKPKSTRRRAATTTPVVTTVWGEAQTTRHPEYVKVLPPLLGDGLLANPFLDNMDTLHYREEYWKGQLPFEIWVDKYRWGDEKDIFDTFHRVARGVYAHDGKLDMQHAREAYLAMAAGLWMPGGRILAGAGTPKRVTMINCFVNSTIEDNMESIQDAMKYTVLTMQQGGGMGTDFSPIRPNNAWLRRTHSKASGPLPFMDQMDGGSRTVRSAGDRRGAMMATLIDTHPDLPDFIMAKTEKGRLTQFNVSVLVSDALMNAVAEDEEWLLYFSIEPYAERSEELKSYDFVDENDVQQFVYSVWRARDLWKMITEHTYEYSEPGTLFIDRINELNNLQHVEQIRCTNPCGEQPLPPNGACDLGAVNLARMVKRPFTGAAYFDYDLLKKVVKVGQRFLDNVLDVTNYPLPQQFQESMFKRRTGLGFSGLADAMMQLGLRYGSLKAGDFAELVTQVMAETSYETSIELAIEKGPCPAFDPCMIQGTTFIAQRLNPMIKDKIAKHGLRNGVLNTVAPTGTTSLVFGDLSGSGCEPSFSHVSKRKVLQADGKSYKEYIRMGYTERLWLKHTDTVVDLDNFKKIEWPSHFVVADDLKIEDHITIQGRVQRWVDASVSKTVNCPKDMSYADFVRVYSLAYSLGCKGCTTYRPSDVRGSILSSMDEGTTAVGSGDLPAAIDLGAERPDVLDGKTYKIKWPTKSSALYLVINSAQDGRPFELFITSKDAREQEWITALTLMITAIFRKGGNVSFVAEELQQIQSVYDTAWIGGKMFGSLPAYIGFVLEQHFKGLYTITPPPRTLKDGQSYVSTPSPAPTFQPHRGEVCPDCKQPTLMHQEGCMKCENCGHSTCG
jgi:ribonucleoside-diphosphate reductase alpha chain